MEQNEILVSVRNLSPTDGAVFNCQAINYHPSLPIIWVVNGVAYSNGPPPRGLQLRSSDLRAALLHMHDVQIPAIYAFGDHRCEVWGNIPDTRAVSSSVFLRLKGRSVKLHRYEESFYPLGPKKRGIVVSSVWPSIRPSVRSSVRPSVCLFHCPSIRMAKLLCAIIRKYFTNSLESWLEYSCGKFLGPYFHHGYRSLKKVIVVFFAFQV